MDLRALLARLPLTLRALVLVPVLAAVMDQARVSLVCPPGAQSCLETAGQSRFGLAAMLAVVTYTSAIAILIARLARGRKTSPLLWIVATAGLWAACGGQAMLVSALGGGAVLGGGWLQMLAFGALAGARSRVRAQGPAGGPRADPLTAAQRPAADDRRPSSSASASPPPRTPQLRRFARFTRDRAPPALA